MEKVITKKAKTNDKEDNNKDINIENKEKEEEEEEEKISIGDTNKRNIEKMLNQVMDKEAHVQPPSDDLLLFLSKTLAEEVKPDRSLLVTYRSTTVADVFKKLIDENVLSLAVLTKKEKYYGFVDMINIVTWLTDLLGERELKKEDLDVLTLQAFRETEVGDIIVNPYSRQYPHPIVQKGSSMLSVIETLCRGVHRVAVIDDEGRLINIITQSMVVRWLSQHKTLLEKKGQVKAIDFQTPCINVAVLSVLDNERAIDAFKMIKLGRLSGIAIVDQEEHLLGNLSSRDIKKISKELRFVHRLMDPVNTFQDHRRKLVVGHVNDSLQDFMDKIIQHNVHRVYVIDNDNHPIGVVSLTDILKELLIGK